nr:hypothetical protein [Virgibacillus sp. MSP4-1]
MKQSVYGFIMFMVLILPPVAYLLESIMIVHMHMQMPLLVISGFLMAPFFFKHLPSVFEKWNHNGVPGILLVVVIWSFWMIPRSMDEALTIQAVEIFKFISLPFLVGVPLRDSWKKLKPAGQNLTYLFFTFMLFVMAWIYISADEQICNNYLEVEQKTLGWGSLALAICLIIYVVQVMFLNKPEEER